MRAIPASLAALTLTLSLAACGSKDEVEVKDAKPAEVAAAVAASGLKPLAGKWESRVKIEKMEIPGMPPEMAAQMQKGMGLDKTFATCLMPEQVEKPDSGFFQAGASGCTYDSFTMAGGTIAGKMTCRNAGAEQVVTMKGTYSAESYDITNTSAAKVDGQIPMNMTMAVSSRRTGACDAAGG